MIAKQDRQGVRKASDIEQKYNLDLDFNAVEKIAANAQAAASNAQAIAYNAMNAARDAETNANLYTDANKIVWETLWENESETFAAQTVELELNEGDLVHVEFDNGSIIQCFVQGSFTAITADGAAIIRRVGEISTAGITFGDASAVLGTPEASDLNTMLVPTRIFRVKGVTIAVEEETTDG